ncbi:probable methyltransferase-like protein 24, partial [Mytilus californianus]|uniref:probable methyltransferase-like protein 24 n=1 Tax=Mytilus californianus TaxID=6549 RepID=UPI0022475ED3
MNAQSIDLHYKAKVYRHKPSYLKSTQIHCKEVIRLGLITDGGWNVCHDKQYRPSHPCLVYSFGIFWDFSFDDAVAETYGCEIHSFDPSMNTSDFKRGNLIWFHKLGLSDKSGIYGKNKWKVSTLQDIFAELNHTSKALDILKMDIESMEWQSLPNMIKTGALRNTRQLSVEIHRHSVSLQMLQTLRSIYDEGYRIYWYHRNLI